MKRALLTLGLIGIMGGALYAQNPVNRRQDIQRQRIQQGARRGEITRTEAQRLANIQQKIRAAEARAKQDGQVTEKEQRRLSQLQNRANRQIFRQNHDRQDRR